MADIPPAQRDGVQHHTVAGIDATDSFAIADALTQLTTQTQQAMAFLRREIPGFSSAHLSGVAPRVGVRETRRVEGDVVLTGDAVRNGKKPTTAFREAPITSTSTERERRRSGCR